MKLPLSHPEFRTPVCPDSRMFQTVLAGKTFISGLEFGPKLYRDWSKQFDRNADLAQKVIEAKLPVRWRYERSSFSQRPMHCIDFHITFHDGRYAYTFLLACVD